jgi:hypothetical protein
MLLLARSNPLVTVDSRTLVHTECTELPARGQPAIWMQTTGASQVRVSSAGSQGCLQLCVLVAVRPAVRLDTYVSRQLGQTPDSRRRSTKRIQLPFRSACPHHGRMAKKDQKRPYTVVGELDILIQHAEKRARTARLWARFWQVADLSLGWSAAVLAAVAGALGLGEIVGREGAAILALSAAALVAGNQFLSSGARYERNRKRLYAFEALACDARLEEAKAGNQPAPGLDKIMDKLLRRQIAINDMDHQAVPAAALGREDSPFASPCTGNCPDRSPVQESKVAGQPWRLRLSRRTRRGTPEALHDSTSSAGPG